jgi:CheY-like chemotaxis protein
VRWRAGAPSTPNHESVEGAALATLRFIWKRRTRGRERGSPEVTSRNMGGGSESKKQLGKILLQQKLVTQDALQEMLDDQKRTPGERLASSAARRGEVSMGDALSALSEQHGVPAVDLSEQVVPLGLLRLIPVEMARERAVFPLRLEGDQLLLAVASPDQRESIEELEFVTGKTITPLVALDHVIRMVIEYAYAGLARGTEYYVGAHVTTAQLAEYGLPDLPRAPAPLEDVVPAEPLSPVADGIDQAFTRRHATSQPLDVQAPDAGSRVLLAVAEATVRTALKQELGAVGIALAETDDGAKALELLREPAQVLIVDAALATIGGFELCRRLRADIRYAAVPLLLISDVFGGWRLAQDAREAFGVQHVFVPPIDVARLALVARLVLQNQPVLDEPPPMSPAADARWNSGMAAYERGELDAAIVELEAGVRIEPQAFELQYHLGLLYGRREQPFSAIRALERALAVQPKHFAAIKNLAVICQRTGMKYKAFDAWQRALVYAPDDETRTQIRQHMISLL